MSCCSSWSCSCSACPGQKTEAPPLRLALVGPPNSGKTSLFNALTGSRQKVGNYAGVTVERKEGKLRLDSCQSCLLLDLPGTMSLRARSPDEAVTRDALLGQRAEDRVDAVICVADATRLRTALRLVIELKRVGLPLILALNMTDIARARGRQIDLAKLSERLGVPVIPCVAVRSGGTKALLQHIATALPALNEKRYAQLGQGLSSWAKPDASLLRHWSEQVETLLKDVTQAPGRRAAFTEKLDRFFLHPVAGPFVLLFFMFVVFQSVFTLAIPFQDAIDQFFSALGLFTQTHLGAGWFRSMLVEGVIAGVGSVMIFLPQIVLLFASIILLEDTGYMARAAFLMDRLMEKVGLHGRAFIPLLSSFACAIPGIMATRTIDNRRARLTTILIAPLMPCAARLPVYTLVIAAFIPPVAVGGVFNLQGLVMFGLYALGIISALIVASFFKKACFKTARQPLLLDMPDYKRPHLRNILFGVWVRVWMFLARAGTIILALTLLLWALSTYPAPEAGSSLPPIETSYIGQLGHFLAPLFAPIGFEWQMTLSLLPAMAAREVALAALGTIYAVGDGSEAVGQTLASHLQESWSLAAALAYLVWFVYAPQCLSTLVVVKRETQSWRWPLVLFCYMTFLAYAGAGATYHLVRFLAD